MYQQCVKDLMMSVQCDCAFPPVSLCGIEDLEFLSFTKKRLNHARNHRPLWWGLVLERLRHLPTGMYLDRLDTAESSSTRKLVLVK